MPDEPSSQPSAMKAWLWSTTAGGLVENLQISQSATPPSSILRQGQVLVQVISMSLNPADYKVPEMASVTKFIIGTPAVPGMDFSGRVVATGPATDGFEPGQLVLGCLGRPVQFGALAEYTVCPVTGLAPLPKGVDPDHAASIGIAAQTAYQSIQPHVAAGEKIFINGGSGGCGIFGIQIAKALGCQVSVSCSTRNVQLCKDLGADEVIDYTSTDVTQALKEQGPVFSLVLDHIGSPANLFGECHHFLLPGKRFIQVGASSMGTHVGRLLRPGFLGGGKRKYEIFFFKNIKEHLILLSEWVRDGKINVLLDSTFEFEDGKKAFEKLVTGRAKGKIVVHVTEKP